MAKYKVGDIITSPKFKDILKIISKNEHQYCFNVLKDPSNYNSGKDFNEDSIKEIDSKEDGYYLINGYDTPLWKLLNE